jgi:NAD(P)-dependent dehydrogenase (short-subunit alcohol dehydrogenase family)
MMEDRSPAESSDGLRGQVAIVTGAANGIGRAFANGLLDQGMFVVACDSDECVHELDAATHTADVSQPDDVERVVRAALDEFGRIDVLVNNAGVVRPSRAGDDWEKGIDDYQFVVGTNLYGAFLFGRAVAPAMIERRSGHIVNICTDHVYPMPPERVWGHGGMDLYNASKWALNGLTLDWATTLRKKGIRVNGICMGATDTPMLRQFAGDAADDVVASWMRPEQICEMLAELLLEGPDGRTGHNLGLWVGRELRLDDSAEVGHRPVDAPR